MLSVISNPPPRTCICTVNSIPSTRTLFQPKWASDNLCNCKRTVFFVQRFLLWGPCLCVKSRISGQIGLSHILDFGQRNWHHYVFSSVVISTTRPVLLPLPCHSPPYCQFAMMFQVCAHGWACINHTTQTPGLWKRQTSIKITSYWWFSFHTDGLSHLDNLVAFTLLKAPKIWIYSIERRRELKRWFMYFRAKI